MSRLALVCAVATSLDLACTRLTTRAAHRREARPGPTSSAASPATAELLDDSRHLPAARRRIVQTALDLAGSPSRRLDCSAFACRAYAAAGVQLPATVREQYRCGAPVSAGDLLPGDLVFFAFERRPADHVGIYAGRGSMIHVSSAAGSVQVARLESPPFAAARVGARRVLQDPEAP